MFLSVITVAFRNYEGVVKTWRSLRNLARDPSLTFEWIVVDGGSNDGTAEFLEKLNGEFNLRYISEKDKGIYDAMNKGINMAQGRYAIFLNSGDVFHEDVALFARRWRARKKMPCLLVMRCLISTRGKSAARRETRLVYLPQPAGQPSGYFLPNERPEKTALRFAL